MANITLATLKKGADSLNIEFEKSVTKKELEIIITEALAKQELGYECPECGKDIPDVDICPFCASNFTEDDAPANDTEEASDNLQIDESSIDIANEDTKEEVVGEVANVEVGDKKGETKAKNKEAKSQTKKDKPKLGNESQAYKDLIEGINEIMDGAEQRVNASGITYLIDKKRIMKVAASAKSISIEFNVELQTQDDSIKTFTAEEAKAKHLGTVRAIYSFGDLETALKLVEEAVEIRKGLVAAK